MIVVGNKAPAFTLLNQNGEKVSLSDFLGKKVVLYFYPKDNTQGCSEQADLFNKMYELFKENNIEIIGISKDSIKSHIKFIEKYDLKFMLLSDEQKEVLQLYDVFKEKSMYGKMVMSTVRSTFIIDENGNVEKIFSKVKAKNNPEEVRDYFSL